MQGLQRLPLSLKHTLAGQDLFPTPGHFSASLAVGPALPLPPTPMGSHGISEQNLGFAHQNLGFAGHKGCERSGGSTGSTARPGLCAEGNVAAPAEASPPPQGSPGPGKGVCFPWAESLREKMNSKGNVFFSSKEKKKKSKQLDGFPCLLVEVQFLASWALSRLYLELPTDTLVKNP